jgi:exosortase
MTLSESVKANKTWLVLAILLLGPLYFKIIPDMVMEWYKDENYSHGFIVPIIAGFFLWERRRMLRETLVEPWGPGLAVLFAGVLQLLVSWLGSEYFLMRSSLIVILAGMMLYFLGRQAFAVAFLPLAYLIFMIPIPYIIYDMVAFPLKLFVTKVSVGFLGFIGIPVIREGNILMFPTTTLEVADACSGIRSLMSLLALSVAYAFYSQKSVLNRWIIIASAIPIAIFTNALRVIVTGILAQFWGARAAEGFFHEFAGLMVFALAIMILVAIGVFLQKTMGKRGCK